MKKLNFIIIAVAIFISAGADAFAAAGKAVEYRNKGYQAQLDGDLDEAIKQYKLAIKADKKFAAVHNDLGIVYEMKNKLKAAEGEYLDALDIDPNNLSAHSNLAALYERQGEVAKAIKHWKKRVKLGKEDNPWTKRAIENLAAYGAEVEEAPKVEAKPETKTQKKGASWFEKSFAKKGATKPKEEKQEVRPVVVKEKPKAEPKSFEEKAQDIAKQYAMEKKNGKKAKAVKKAAVAKKPGAVEKEMAAEKAEKKGRIKEALEKTARTGFKGYYYQGEGYGITPWLGISAYTEIYEEPDPIDDLVFDSKVLGYDNKNQFVSQVLPLTNRAYAGRVTFDNPKVEWTPRVRLTYDLRETLHDYQVRYNFKHFQQETKEIDIQKTYDYDYIGFVTWNPGYKRVILSSEQDNPTAGHRDDYYFAFTITPNDVFETYTKLEYYEEKKVNTPWISKPKYGLGSTEFRIKVPSLRLRITPGASYSRTMYRPTSNKFSKAEIYLDTGIDFTDKFRGSFRAQNNILEGYDTAFPDREVKVSTYDFTNKLSYEVIKDVDVSAGLNYAHAPGKIDAFDNISPLIEAELFKPGKIRLRGGYQFVDYYNLEKSLALLYLRAYFFM